ncbi:MAG: TetR/AcrR family transcriptional regulator [Reyranella sp.]|nr:TetR/AcrR family transcriptional regulator [Reyranella sp.]
MVDAVVEAAARILETRGLGGFNTNAVAERAGISVGSLYQYFPSKEAVVAALSVRERALLAAEVAAAAQSAASLSLEDALHRLAGAAIRRQLARPALARILDFEEQRLALEESDRATTRDIAGHVVALLRAHGAVLTVADLEKAAFDVIAIARALIDAAAGRGAVEPTALEGRIVRAALGYLTGLSHGAC